MFSDESSPGGARAPHDARCARASPPLHYATSEYVNAKNFRQQYLNRGYPCGKKVTLVFFSSKLWNETMRPGK